MFTILKLLYISSKYSFENGSKNCFAIMQEDNNFYRKKMFFCHFLQLFYLNNETFFADHLYLISPQNNPA